MDEVRNIIQILSRIGDAAKRYVETGPVQMLQQRDKNLFRSAAGEGFD